MNNKRRDEKHPQTPIHRPLLLGVVVPLTSITSIIVYDNNIVALDLGDFVGAAVAVVG